MRFAIVQKDEKLLAHTKCCLKRLCAERNMAFRLTVFADGIDVVSDYSAEYDVIFIDVDDCDNHMDGFKAAEIIRGKDSHIQIVLTSSDVNCAIRGYSVEAAYFLLKPFSRVDIERALDACLNRLRLNGGEYIVFVTDNGFDRIYVNTIMYIESQNHRKIICTEHNKYTVYSTMESLSDKLPENRFMRINNCYIVNLDFVRGVHGDYAVCGNEELKIARSRRKPFIDTWRECEVK